MSADYSDQAAGLSSPAELAELMARVASRDLGALKQLYRCTSPKLYLVAFRITGSPEAAEDVLQEVYIKVWNRAAGFDSSRNTAFGWLLAVTRNSAVDWHRAQPKRITTGLAAIEGFSDGSTPIDEELIEREGHGRAARLINDLDGELGNNLRDVYLQGMTYSEIAERDGVPLGTIKSRIHRALRTLSKRWAND